MRKFAIAIVLTALATVGFGIGSASAQLEPVCEGLQGISDGARDGDPGQFGQPGGPGTPVKQIAGGAAESCRQSIAQQAPVLDPLICGVADGLIGMPDPVTPQVGQGVKDSGLAECGGGPTGDDDDDDDDGDDDDDDGDDDDDTDVEGEVVDRNAAAGGTLPRTGGELQLLGGLSMGLTGLGVFVRRFLG